MITFDDFRSQGSMIEALRKQAEEKRLVHALLITGEQGTGKRTLAMLFASALMCEAESAIPCGKCSGCTMAMAGEHPDITILEKGVPLSSDTSKGRATIPVDDIREVIRICSRYAYEGRNRAVVIKNAETMTPAAQNSLLKILEEPPQNTYFILTSAHADQLLTTVRSRCRTVKLTPWEPGYVRKALSAQGIDAATAEKAANACGGSIGKAAMLAGDEGYWKLREDVMSAFFRNRKRSEILTQSTRWKDQKAESDRIFDLLEGEIHNLLRYRLTHDGGNALNEFPEGWKRFAAEAPPERFVFLNDRIREARKQCAFNVNFQAIIEQLLLIFIGESDQWHK